MTDLQADLIDHFEHRAALLLLLLLLLVVFQAGLSSGCTIQAAAAAAATAVGCALCRIDPLQLAQIGLEVRHLRRASILESLHQRRLTQGRAAGRLVGRGGGRGLFSPDQRVVAY